MKTTWVVILSLTAVGCHFKKEEGPRKGSAPNAPQTYIQERARQKEQGVLSLKVQYSTNLQELRNLSLLDPQMSKYQTDYFITVPEVADVQDDFGSETPIEEVTRVSFVLRIPAKNELRIYAMAKLEYKDGFKDLGAILEEHEVESGVARLRISVPNFQTKIRFLPNEEKVLRLSIFFGTEEQKITIPLRTASVIALGETPVFNKDQMKRDDGENFPFKVVPLKRYKLTNPSNEILTFVTETKVSGTLYRYVDEETGTTSDCGMVTNDRQSSSRGANISHAHSLYKVPKNALFVLGAEDDDKEALIERATTSKRTFITTTLNEQEGAEYTLYMLIPRNSFDLDALGSCGTLRTRSVVVSCNPGHCEYYACKWINGSGDDAGGCIRDYGCDSNGCNWQWTQGCPGPNPNRDPICPGCRRGFADVVALFDMPPRTCVKCTGGQHWEPGSFGSVEEHAQVTGYGIEFTNPFKSTTIQTTKVPVRQTHQKAARIMDVNTKIALTGTTIPDAPESLSMPTQCKLECLTNPNDPGCYE